MFDPRQQFPPTGVALCQDRGMPQQLASAADDAEARALGDDPIAVRMVEDMPAGDNLATVRAAWEWLTHFRAQATYQEDAARRTGHARAAERHRQEAEQADLVLAQLHRMWAGGDTAVPNIVDELRREIGRLNYLLDRALRPRAE